MQQTFFIYAEKRASIRDVGKVKSWLFTTLYRNFLSRRAKDRRLAHYEPQVLESIAGPQQSDMSRGMDRNLAVEALQQLDVVYRDSLSLFYLKQLSYKEIAAVLDVPIGTVMSRLSRGKTQLREIFNGTADGSNNGLI